MSQEADELLATCDPEVQAITQKLRELIRTHFPKAQEKVHKGWQSIAYTFDGGMKQTFCSLGPQKGYVNVYFNRGAELADPAKLLTGGGKQMRHVKIRQLADTESEALLVLLQTAVALVQPPAQSS